MSTESRDILKRVFGYSAFRGNQEAIIDSAMASSSRKRPMTNRWISFVPSPISQILASRIMRSTGYSLVYPAPPRTWMAPRVALMASSEQNSFAIETSRTARSPRAILLAAE